MEKQGIDLLGHKSPHLTISGGEINCIELNTKTQIARARFWHMQGKKVLWIGCKRENEEREETTGDVDGIDARSGVAENARWALHVAGAVAGVGIAWFYIKSMEVHVSR